jgi:hypothetical protein
VVRTTLDVTGAWTNPHVMAVFELYDVATEACGGYYQEWADKGANVAYVNFDVQATTFYG